MLDALRRDAATYTKHGGWYACPGFWIVAVHRFGTWADALPGLLRLPCWILYRLAHLGYLGFNIHLWAGARGSRLGAGLCLIHPNNLYFGPGVVIGDDCLIHHEVTFGMGATEETPVIGTGVVIMPGARLLGGLSVGDHAIVGANCVVTQDVAAGAVVMPAANRVLPRSLSAWARRKAPVATSSGTTES